MKPVIKKLLRTKPTRGGRISKEALEARRVEADIKKQRTQ